MEERGVNEQIHFQIMYYLTLLTQSQLKEDMCEARPTIDKHRIYSITLHARPLSGSHLIKASEFWTYCLGQRIPMSQPHSIRWSRREPTVSPSNRCFAP